MNINSRNTFRLGYRPVKEGPRSLLNSQDRVDKSATGKPTSTKGKRAATEKRKTEKKTH